MKYTIKYKTKHKKTKHIKTKHKKTKHIKTKHKHKTSKNKTSKNKTSKNKTSKNKSRKYYKGKQRGGSEELAVKPFKMLDFPAGTSSASQAAMQIGIDNNKKQYEMNKIGGRGGGEPQDTENVTTSGDDSNSNSNTKEVPQFFPTGGIKTAYTSTDQSAAGNLTSLTGAVDSTYDHFAREQAGGGRRRKY
jgi:hypothetical protein